MDDGFDHHWRLYCAGHNTRWHYYDTAEPTPDIGDDPTGIFWG